ncbi:hypothetical protein [Halotia branconii]|uniref:Uncharacterized protein n=1 Tax=Halotia branconii CENA392 TaxID=1539056 RepID=A0AAJ6PAW7_9CYAN|nr:hypothetical protein [Halotia branconii]WGV27151.1 hypothetical protein QI031_06565 [Halotia branconii CENA392]
MLVSEILHTLPAPLEWMVLFNLSPIRHLANEDTIKAMYHLPMEIDLTAYSHVVLASSGRFLASADQSRLVEAVSGKGWSRESIRHSLFDRFAKQLALFPVDEADCLGLGEQLDIYPPVLLHIKIQEGIGHAQAIFEREPTKEHYELLQAVGVKFLGGEAKEGYYLAQFQNRLPVHIHAGILSHFSRTAHCNLFFLQHGNIDPPLENGLLKAAEGRITWARNLSIKTLTKLALKTSDRSLAMICQSPPPNPSFPYGDLVPLGFLLNALNTATNFSETLDNSIAQSTIDARQVLSQFLLNQRQDHLWAFHSNRLVTATDSALILQGFNDPNAVEALERFADGLGGYYPQLWSIDEQPKKMVLDQSCRHWCQSDYATTCMVKALRQEAKLETKTPADYLTVGMANRSGLYFANPYLVDWVLARAICHDQSESAALLRQQLLSEVLASLNADYSFGKYDVALSTALGILIMAALGFRGRTMRAAQIRLLEFIDTQGRWPITIPFYSSLRLDPEIPTKDLLELSMINAFVPKTSIHQQRQVRNIQNQYHGISLYWDVHRCISTSLAFLALSEPCSPTQQDLPDKLQDVHPRYLCDRHCEYIAKFALPPYLATQALVNV